MKKKSLRMLCIVLVFGLLFANILYENTPVQAAGDSSATGNSPDTRYKWYQAKSLDDLKKYYDKDREETWNYQGTWMPIIIVAQYPDGTCYYMNRDTELIKYHTGEDAEIPRLKKVDSSSSVGRILQDAMKESGEFYTNGDLHAMHMFYHGTQTSYYKDGSITADAWSLTKENVRDVTFGRQSFEAPATVYGVRDHSNYVMIDQNNVLSWDNSSSSQTLPRTQSPRDTGVEFRQAWSFIPYKNGTFLISNMFSRGTKFKLSTTWTDACAMTLGCVLSNASRLSSADKDRREILETPSRAAASIYNKKAEGHTLQGEAARRAIIEQYEYKYDEQETRVQFKIFVGQKEDGGQAMDSETVTGKKIIGNCNKLPDGKRITVEKGAVLVVPKDSTFYLSGEIINYGTVIIGENSTVTAENPSVQEKYYGAIQCLDGGTLIVMKNAKVALGLGLNLEDSTVVNQGVILLDGWFYMDNAQIQMEKRSSLVIGVQLWTPEQLADEKINSFESWLRSKYSETEQTGGAVDTKTYMNGNSNCQVFLKSGSRLYISQYNRFRNFSDTMIGMDFSGKQKEIKESGTVKVNNKDRWSIYSAD